mgnify:CR=1 FL=1
MADHKLGCGHVEGRFPCICGALGEPVPEARPGYVTPEGYTLDQALKSVGKGWGPLLLGLWGKKAPDILVVQVKEKFGGLRVYFDTPPAAGDAEVSRFSNAVTQAESASYRICELCGKPGWLRPHHWFRVFCNACDIAWHLKNPGREPGAGGDQCKRTKEDQWATTISS